MFNGAQTHLSFSQTKVFNFIYKYIVVVSCNRVKDTHYVVKIISNTNGHVHTERHGPVARQSQDTQS